MDFPDEYCTWEPEAQFDNTEPIHEYWRKQQEVNYAAPNVTQNIKINQPRKTARKSWIMKSLLLLTMLFSTFTNSIEAIMVTQKFKFCQVYDRMILDLTDTCVENTVVENSKAMSLHILNQRTNKISGTAFQCKKQRIKITTYKSLLWYDSTNIEKSDVELTREDCITRHVN